jgi:hypothetical protein
MTSARVVSIPEPILPGDLYQLAQFTTTFDGVVCAYWWPESRKVVLQSGDKWAISEDGNILETIADFLNIRKASLINMSDLFFFETAGHGKLQDTNTHNSFYMCDWSDYGCDHIAIQAHLDYPYDD